MAAEAIHKEYLKQTLEVLQLHRDREFIKGCFNDNSKLDHQDLFLAEVQKAFNEKKIQQKPYQKVQFMTDLVRYADKMDMEIA